MQILLKYKIFRIANYGVINTINFKEKKTLQIFNVFLLLVCVNVFLMSILLIIFGFYGQLIPATLSFFSLVFSLFLNKRGHTLFSKIFIIQFHIISILTILIVFSFTSIFSLYFFLVILYCSLIFYESEKRIMLFFIIQCLFFLFIALTPLHGNFPKYYSLNRDEISKMNLICIVGYIFFLFIFIYFHTEYQRKLELKYLSMNKRLIIRNEINKKNNNNTKKLLKIISTSLQKNLEDYKNLFENYLTIINEKPNKLNEREKLYLRMSAKNKEIEELINFRFTNSRDALLQDNFITCGIKEKSMCVIKKMNLKNININTKNDFTLTFHQSLYETLLMETINNKISKYQPKEIFIEIDCTSKSIEYTSENAFFTLFGITISYNYNKVENKITLQFLFLFNPDDKAIYYV